MIAERGAGRPRRKILLFITVDWYYWSHRKDLGARAVAAGYEVVLATNVSTMAERIEAQGVRVVPLRLDRRSKNPLGEIAAVLQLVEVLRQERPDLIHNVALKPILYGSIAGWLAGVPWTVNAVPGLGYAFLSEGLRAWLLRLVLVAWFRIAGAVKGAVTVFQNPEDRDVFERTRILPRGVGRIIRGAGVALEEYPYSPVPELGDEPPLVLMPARMLWDKGVREFAEAAISLTAEGVRARFVMVGRTDAANPACIPEPTIRGWTETGAVEWWGLRRDMVDLYSRARFVVLPSYREGLPRVLLEAGAVGRAAVTTDTTGCREVVRDGENGILVEVRSPEALATGIRSLLDRPEIAVQMGRRAYEIVRDEFCDEVVNGQFLKLYGELLGGC